MATVHPLTDDEMNTVAELAHVRETLRKMKEEEATLRADVEAILGDADVGEYDGKRVVCKSTSWTERFDVKRFRSIPGYEDLVAAYTVTSPVTSVRLT